MTLKTKLNNWMVILLLNLSFLLLLPQTSFAQDNWEDITNNMQEPVSEVQLPDASIVIDAHNGQVLWEKNTEKAHDPAALTMLMTVYLTMEKIQDNTFSLDTTVTATAEDEAIAQLQTMSNNNVVTGGNYQMEDLLKLAFTPTSNVAILMLSRMVDKDPDQFIEHMNTKASELGMTNTKYFNATGIPASTFEGNYLLTNYDNAAYNQTTAADLALLTYHLLKNFPEIIDWTKETETTVLPDSLYEETFTTNNQALTSQAYPLDGLDGLLFFENGQINHYVTTVKRNGMRLISVFLNANGPDEGSTFRLNNTLLNKLFEKYEYKEILTAGKQKINNQTVNVTHDFYGVVLKETEPTFELSEDKISLKNSLPLVSNTIDPLEVEYEDARSNVEKNIEENRLVTWLLETIEITKTTILAIGFTLLGIIFLLMSLFIPRRKKVEKTSRPLESEITSRREKQKSQKQTWPIKETILFIGSSCFIVGIIMLLIHHLL